VQIRGTSSLPTVEDLKNETRVDLNTPLIILDGVEISLARMRDLNDEDINSVTILKDGSATAIYGSRGANGVVVIESKRPEIGRLRLSYRGGLNLETPDLTGYNVLNAREKLQLELEAGLYSSGFANVDMSLRERYNTMLEEVERGVDTYWLSKPVQIGAGHRHNFRIEGGNADGFRYAVSLQYNDVKGVMKGSQRKTFNGAINLVYEHKNLLFTNNLEIGNTVADESPYGSFRNYVYLNPYWTERDKFGKMRREFESKNENFFNPAPENPMYNATLDVVNRQRNTVIFNNFNLEWRPWEDFVIRSRFGISKRFNSRDVFKPAGHTDFKDYSEDKIFRKGQYRYSTGSDLSYDLDITLNYSHRFGDKHTLFAGLNYNLAQQQSELYTFVMEGFPQSKFKQLSMALQYEEKGKPVGTDLLNRRIGLTGNVNYIYDNRYFADLAYRLDGASQ
ncbi:MAG: TonB-dependent receptor plug domain-containing protein, partial [Prevotella pleuritidis]|nr:TonB-dependent receptor plug domain-containing protein [Hoylesella pleuritidis]